MLYVPARGASALEDPGGPVLEIPQGTTLCFATLGRWDPALLGSAGLDISSFGGRGVRAERFTSASNFQGIVDQRWLNEDANWFSLVLRESPAHPDPDEQKVRRGLGSSGWGYAFGQAHQVRRYELMMNDQFEEFYNNTGGVLFIYFFEDAIALPWGVDLNDFKLPEYVGQSSSAQADGSGLIYDWEIVGFNKYKSNGAYYEYRFVIKNTANAKVLRYLWAKDDTGYFKLKGERIELDGNEGTRRQLYMKGMTIKEVVLTPTNVAPWP